MNIGQTVDEILTIKRMLHAGAAAEDVQRYIEQQVKPDKVCSTDCEAPALCGTSSGSSAR